MDAGDDVELVLALCRAREKIRFDDDFRLLSALARTLESRVLTEVFFAKFTANWVERVAHHRVLYLLLQQLLVER